VIKINEEDSERSKSDQETDVILSDFDLLIFEIDLGIKEKRKSLNMK